MSDDLDWGEAAEYIVGQRPELDAEHVWAVLKELGDPPARAQEDLALQLISGGHPEIKARDAKKILAEWRAYADIAGEGDWDD